MGKGSNLKVLLEHVLAEYIPSKQEPIDRHDMADVFRNDIVDELYSWEIDYKRYEIKGLVGDEAWTDIPLVAIFDKQIGNNNQAGVYIAYLFSKDCSRCYLSLMQGCLYNENERVRNKVIKSLQTIKRSVIRTYDCSHFTTEDTMELGSGLTGIASMYTSACICYKEYKKGAVPDDNTLKTDLLNLMKIYKEFAVKIIPGKAVSSIPPVKGTSGDENMNNAKFDKNTILYGPPGTGKTYSVAKYAVRICCDGFKKKDMDNYPVIMENYRQLMAEERVAFVTFHQSYGYEEFIEGIRPVLEQATEVDANAQKGQDLKYTIEDGIFKSFCARARKAASNKPYVFVIDEINRGNISKIFGELITLIEDTKREGSVECIPAILPYSGEEFAVPDNVYILGTMNTADRSIALMDTALRRRFKFIEMLPDPSLLEGIVVSKGGRSVDIGSMLSIINERITYLYDREHTLGHALFMSLRDDNSLDNLASIFKKSVLPLLQEYFYEDYEKIRLVLGDNAKGRDAQFVLAENIPGDTFEKAGSSDIDIPEVSYSINEDSFKNIMAYKGISKKL